MNTSQERARDAAERVIVVCDVLADLVPSDVDAFTADVRTQWAAEMGLIRIGEAVHRIPAEVLDLFEDQPWRQIVALRTVAAHQYDDLDARRVWRTVTRDVPRLRGYLADTVIPELSRQASSGPGAFREPDSRALGGSRAAPPG